MTSMADDFVPAWSQLVATRSSAKVEVDPTHPLRLLYGVDDYGKPLFFAITAGKPPMPEISRDVNVTRGQRTTDGKWTLALTLQDQQLFDVFAKLCLDLVEQARPAMDENDALQLFLEALAQWKHLLQPARPEHLTLEALRGLLGELWFGFKYLGTKTTAETILSAWTGPLGAPQDFNFASDKAFEVKTVRSNASAVQVSSAQQLDPLHKHLRLVVVTLEDCDPTHPDGLQLPKLANSIRASLSASPQAQAHFERILREYPVDTADPFYLEHCFRSVTHREYVVSEDFPAIRASALVPGIREVRYSLDLAILAAFLTDPTLDEIPPEDVPWP